MDSKTVIASERIYDRRGAVPVFICDAGEPVLESLLVALGYVTLEPAVKRVAKSSVEDKAVKRSEVK